MVVLGVLVPVGGCISLCLFAAAVALAAVVVVAVAVMVGMYVPSHHRHWLKKLCKRLPRLAHTRFKTSEHICAAALIRSQVQ